MARITRGLRIFLVAAAVVVTIIVVLLVVLTRTDFGVEQAGRFAVDRLRSSIEGELRVGGVTSRGLLRGVTLHDVAIDDLQGRPFIRADSARLAYHLRTLLGGDIAFDRLIVYSPVVHFERLPGQEQWNYERIFAGDTTATVPDTTTTGLVQIDDATIVDGLVFVRFPFEPELPVEPDDTARLILEEVPGGVVRVLRFEGVDGRLPRIVWDSPETDAKLIRIGQLAARAYIWETPIEVRRLEGTLTIRDSLLTFEAPRVQLPRSELEMAGRIILAEEGNRYDVEAHGDDLSFADFQWLYPPLPEDGGGALRFRMQSQDDDNILWLARDARLRTGGTQVTGSFGVVTGDTLYFTNVDLEASPLDLELLQSMLPGELPLEGLLIGTVEVEGPISALRTRGDVRYRDPLQGDGESAVRWAGTVRAQRPWSVTGLEAELRQVDLGQIARVFPGLELRGVVTGQVGADGSLAGGLRLSGDVALERDGTRSAVRGGGVLAVGGDRSRFDLQFDAEPLGLELLAAQFPALARLTGEARGPVTVRGSLADLRVDADIMTPAGAIELAGAFALTGDRPVYRASGAVADFHVDQVVSGIPPTRLTGRFDLDGAGQRMEELDGALALQVFAAEVDGVPVHGGIVRVSAADGVAHVDTLDLTTAVGDVAAAGTIGLIAGRQGEVRFALRADSVGLLERLILAPPALPDTAFFPAARLAGVLTADGVIRGSIDEWSLAGRGSASNPMYEGVRARRAAATVEWSPTPRHLVLAATLDSLHAGGRILPHGRLEGRYEAGAGEILVVLQGPGSQSLEADAAFDRIADGTRFTVRSLALDTRDGRWELADTVAGRAGRTGFGIEPMVLARGRDGARVELAGVLPWSDPDAAESRSAAFSASVERLPLGEILRIAQADTILDGAVTGRVAVSGTALAPVIEGVVVARGFRYREATLDSVAADLRYRSRAVTGHVAAWRQGQEILRGEGTVPVELALADLDERRLDRPMEVRVTVDSVPAGLVAFLAPGFSRVAGTLDGTMVLGGTPRATRFQGELRLADGSGFFEHSAVHYRRVNAVARMQDTELAVEGTLRTESGSGEIRGTLDLERPGDPSFDLELIASQLDASRRRDVVAVADGRIRVEGRYSAPIVSGAVRFTEGQLNLGEILRQYRIVQLEPWFYEVLDTTSLAFRPPQETPFLANLRVTDAVITVARDFWLRGPELSVEVAGELEVEYDRPSEDLRLSGSLQAVRGTYELRVIEDVPGRRFDIRSGTIDFVGTPGIDPNLDIAARYRLRRAQGESIDVLAQVGGTLQSPRVSLMSESDLPISESDLASYIIFGRSAAELTQSESDVLSSSRLGSGAFGQLGRGVSGLIAPTVYGFAASGLQSLLPVDYVALTASSEDWQLFQPASYLRDAQLELGRYAVRDDEWGDLFLVGTLRIPRGTQPGNPLLSSLGGVRAEWRFRPTWTSELYFEDRFARTPSFGLQEIEDRRVWGLSLFREWGY